VAPDGSTAATPLDMGAGREDLAGVVNPGLVMDVTFDDMVGAFLDPMHRIDLNEPSVYNPSLPGRVTTTRTLTNPTSKNESFKVSATSDLPGGVSVSPSSFSLKPGASVTLAITLDGTDGTVGGWYFGQIDFVQSNGPSRLHLPVAFSPSDPEAAAVTLSTSCTPTSIAIGATTTCTAHVVNKSFSDASVRATMASTNNLKVASSNGTIHGRDVTYGPTTLAAAVPGKPHADVVPDGSPAGYLNLSGFSSGALRPIGDEAIVNFNVPAYVFNGRTYSQLGIVSNGYLVVGGGDASDVRFESPGIPNASRPNNVLAPFWADLDGGAGAVPGAGYRITVLTAGPGASWIVVQWDEPVFGNPTIKESFQVWLGINGTEDISYTYGVMTNPGATTTPAVGVEDASGLFGNQIAGMPSDDILVTSSAPIPGGTADFTAVFRGTQAGAGTVETTLGSNVMRDTSVRRNVVTVLP
ncbi:MAG TPA: hypothetical protein VFR93_04795, partial [Candidatus Limnocylindrales bacterium]|nr:hypothetical protein [Candidatus Limnocylindrales bacterium]